MNEQDWLSEIQIFPNPAYDFISIAGNGSLQIEISDVAGRVAISESRIDANRTIDIRELDSGLYTITIKSLTETVSLKLLIAH